MEMDVLSFLPTLWALWTVVGIIITYTLTIVYNHHTSYVMYISYTGCEPPETYVFAGVLWIAALLDAIIKILMYRRISLYTRDMKNTLPWLQIFVLLVGLIGAFGTVVVGYYPVTTFPQPHYMGAFSSFIGTAIHNAVQARLLCRLNLSTSRLDARRFRFCVILIVSLVIFAVSKMFHNKACTTSTCQEITNTIDIIAEWVGATCMLLYTLTPGLPPKRRELYVCDEREELTVRTGQGFHIRERRRIHITQHETESSFFNKRESDVVRVTVRETERDGVTLRETERFCETKRERTRFHVGYRGSQRYHVGHQNSEKMWTKEREREWFGV